MCASLSWEIGNIDIVVAQSIRRPEDMHFIGFITALCVYTQLEGSA